MQVHQSGGFLTYEQPRVGFGSFAFTPEIFCDFSAPPPLLKSSFEAMLLEVRLKYGVGRPERRYLPKA